MAFNPHRDLLAIGSENASHGTVTLLSLSDPADPQRLGSPLAVGYGAATSVALSPNGHMLAVADLGGYVELWDIAKPTNAQPLRRLHVDSGDGPARSLAFSLDGATLAVDANGISLWNVARGEKPYSLPRDPAWCADQTGSVVFGPDSLLVVSCDNSPLGSSVSLWDAAVPADPTPVSPPQAISSRVLSLALSPDGRTLISASLLKASLLWNLPPVMFSHSPVSAAYSTQRHILATGGFGNPIQLWKLNDRGIQVSFGPQPGAPFGSNVTALGLNLAGDILAAGESDGSVQLWDVANLARPRKLMRLRGNAIHIDCVAVAFSPDGRMLATGDANGNVRLWDITRRRHRIVESLHPNSLSRVAEISSLAFSSTGRLLATGASDGTVQLWNLTHPARAKPLGRPFYDLADADASVVFSSTDGNLLAIAGRKNSLQVWTTAYSRHPRPLGQPLSISNDHGSVSPQVLALVGTTVITSAYGLIRVWDMNVRAAIKRICAIPGLATCPR